MAEFTKYDLEDRLVEFSILVIEIVESLPETRAGNHIAGQLIRCGTSPTLNYGEAQSAASRNDFINKMTICLKELRETMVCFKIISKKPLIRESLKLSNASDECNQLISIFVKSIETAVKNREIGRPKQNYKIQTPS